MTMALSATNKLGFVNITIIKLVNPTDPLLSSWMHYDNMVTSWILINYVSNEISANLLYMTTAYEIWIDLKEHFSPKNSSCFQLYKSISTFSQGQLSMSAYFTRLKALRDELIDYKPTPACSYGAVHTLNNYVQQESIL